MENLVNYQWQLSLGETELTEKEFKTLAKLKSPLVQIRGQWVTLDAEQIEAAIKFWEEGQTQGEMGLLEAMRLSLGGETLAGGLPVDEVVTYGWLGEWMEQFTQSDELEQLDQPVGLLGKLRPYQQYGYSWLAFLRKWGLGACLADDMGLGKTIQTISLLLREKERLGKLPAPVLLIAPTSVVTNWERGIGRPVQPIHLLYNQVGGRKCIPLEVWSPSAGSTPDFQNMPCMIHKHHLPKRTSEEKLITRPIWVTRGESTDPPAAGAHHIFFWGMEGLSITHKSVLSGVGVLTTPHFLGERCLLTAIYGDFPRCG